MGAFLSQGVRYFRWITYWDFIYSGFNLYLIYFKSQFINFYLRAIWYHPNSYELIGH